MQVGTMPGRDVGGDNIQMPDTRIFRDQGENLSAAEVTDAAGGNLLNFMISELDRAAEQKIDEEGE